MPDKPSAPKLNPGIVQLAGQDIVIAFDVDPAVFPNGCEFIIMMPGRLEPIGKMDIVRGCMIAVVPPEMATHMRPQIKKAVAEQQRRAMKLGVQ